MFQLWRTLNLVNTSRHSFRSSQTSDKADLIILRSVPPGIITYITRGRALTTDRGTVMNALESEDMMNLSAG